MFINETDDMEQRLTSEFDYLCNKYPKIAFNCIDWNHNLRQGKEYLYPTEGYITIPQNYSPDVISKFKGLITHNTKFYEQNKDKFNIILSNGPLNSHNYYGLDYFRTFEEKINGVCSLNRIYHTGKDGDILHLRESLFGALTYPIKHTYGPGKWGGQYYQGTIQANHPNHINNLDVINKYRFVLTLEPMYHEMWSYDWVTERMWNAFKAKTIPIYYGCYNIEKLVPKDLFIDLRDFNLNMNSVSNHISNISKEQYIDMTEKAYDWYFNECKISKMKDLEDIFKGL